MLGLRPSLTLLAVVHLALQTPTALSVLGPVGTGGLYLLAAAVGYASVGAANVLVGRLLYTRAGLPAPTWHNLSRQYPVVWQWWLLLGTLWFTVALLAVLGYPGRALLVAAAYPVGVLGVAAWQLRPRKR